MEWESGEYVAVNELSATMSGTTVYDVEDLYYGSDRVYRAYANDSSNNATLVWDIHDTWLEANDFYIPSSGGTVKTYASSAVESVAWDLEEYDEYNIGYSVSPTKISATTKDYTTYHDVTITQYYSGISVTVSAIQDGRYEVDASYGTPTITGMGHNNIPASGGTSYLTIQWSQVKTITYDNDTTSTETVTGTSIATILSGTVQQTGASITSDGGIYKTSCGTTVTPQRTVYTVKSYRFVANGVTRTVSNASYNIGQAANTETVGSYNLSISADSTSLVAAGGTRTITVSCTRNYSYTSGASQTKNATATISSSPTSPTVTLSKTSITGNNQTLTATISENTSSSTRSIKITATAESTTKSVTITQSAVSYVFTATTKTISVAYNATSVTLTGTSSRNGFYQEIAKKDVSLDSYTISSPSIGTITSSGTTFSIPISFNANDATTAKTLKATVTQPLSGKTITYTITQAGKPASTDFIYWETGSGKWYPGARFTFTARLIYHKSIHGSSYTAKVIPMKGSTELTSGTSVVLNGSYYNTNYYYKDVTVIVSTSNDGSIFYLKAIYGDDTAQIQLVESSDLT